MRQYPIQKKYFDSLDAFRFIAFFIVFISHVPLPNLTILNWFSESGGVGVRFFFVLSGFLITYILIEEKAQTGKIKLRKFLMRRVLRIWPLFFLLLLFAYLTPYILSAANLPFSAEGYAPNWLWSCLFLENYQMLLTDSFANVSPLRVMWSVCIEEHYYLIWGFLVLIIPLTRLPVLIAIAILIGIVSRAIYWNHGLLEVDLLTNFDYFAFGAIPAYLVLKKHSFINRIGKIPLIYKLIFSLLVICFIVIAPQINTGVMRYFNPIIFSVSFMLILFFTLTTENRIYIGPKSIMSRLGKYTYGLYLYHTICISFLLQLTKKFNLQTDEPLTSILILIGSLLLSIGVSIASYVFFENRFIKLKKYFY